MNLNGAALPPGWRVGEGPSGRVHVLRPAAEGKWTEVPIVDDPQVGTEAERAALAELKAWRAAR
jgi:hypothetical protein